MLKSEADDHNNTLDFGNLGHYVHCSRVNQISWISQCIPSRVTGDTGGLTMGMVWAPSGHYTFVFKVIVLWETLHRNAALMERSNANIATLLSK